jgi:hypothetical protein
MDENEIVETAAAAGYLSMEPQTLSKWRCRRRGPVFLRIGGKIRYKISDLKAFLEKSRVDPAEQPIKRRQPKLLPSPRRKRV